MSDPRFIGRVPATTPAEPGTPRERHRAIPYDLLKDASRRVGILSLLSAVLWVLGTLGYHVASKAMTDTRWAEFQMIDAIAVASVAISLALYFYARPRPEPEAHSGSGVGLYGADGAGPGFGKS